MMREFSDDKIKKIEIKKSGSFLGLFFSRVGRVRSVSDLKLFFLECHGHIKQEGYYGRKSRFKNQCKTRH